MAYMHLIRHWLGVPREVHTAGWKNPDEYDSVLERERQQLERAALEGIIERATEGDAVAVSWLEDRGWISLPAR